MGNMLAALSVALLLATPALAQDITAYGESWYRAEFWSGEYPNGFTMLKDTVVQLRPTLDPAAEKTIACPLLAKATYHSWNAARVDADGLHFVAYNHIDEMEVTSAYEATLYTELDTVETMVKFGPGARWNYLVYYGEGAYLLEYEGVNYEGDQGLLEVSRAVKEGESGYHEWLRINCSTNQWGWLFMDDIVRDDVTFTGPNILGYGEAADAE